MDEMLYYIIYTFFIVLGYLCGSILNGYLVPKMIKHIDVIKLSDDNNPGTFNAFKYSGAFCGSIVVLLDLLKGFLPVFIALRFVDSSDSLFILLLLAPVLGHAFPIYNGFKNGGKCICVSFGVLIGMLPYATPLLALAFWYVFFSVILIINPNCLRSVVTYICWIITLLFLVKEVFILIACTLIGGIVIFKHLKSLKVAKEKEVYFIFRRN